MPTTRRQFLGAALGVPALLRPEWRTWDSDADPLVPSLKRVTIPVRGLDRRLDGMTIGQVSDAHIGRWLGVDHLLHAVERLAPERPHLLAVTGDLVDSAPLTAACLDVLARIPAPGGRFLVMGNHENYAGRDDVIAQARAHPHFRFLLAEEALLDVHGARIHVSGLDYPPGRQHLEVHWRSQPLPHVVYRRLFPDMAADVAAVTRRADDADFRLCLAHHPDYFDAARTRGVELTLAGHTHGGQVAPLGTLLARGAFTYCLGVYEVDNRHCYVSGGTGHWYPLRVGVPAEVALITLRRL